MFLENTKGSPVGCILDRSGMLKIAITGGKDDGVSGRGNQENQYWLGTRQSKPDHTGC